MRQLTIVCGLLACAHPSGPSPTQARSPAATSEPDRPVPAHLTAEVERVKGIATVLSEIVENSVSATRLMVPLRKPADPAVIAVLTVQTPWAQGSRSTRSRDAVQPSASMNSAPW